MPDNDNTVYTKDLPPRKSFDIRSNNYGNKLLAMCKECDLCIVNGRIEPGRFTCYNFTRNLSGASVVDYVLSSLNIYSLFKSMKVYDLTEFSDHCPIEFVMNIQNVVSQCNNVSYDKLIWDDSKTQDLITLLEEKRFLFDDLHAKFTSNELTLDSCMESLSDIIYDVSFSVHGRTFKSNTNSNTKCCNKKSPWFNNDCKQAKSSFCDAKRNYSTHPNDVSRTLFLTARSHYCAIKRKAKQSFYSKEKCTMSNLCKSNSRKFWQYIKTFNKKSTGVSNDISLDSFVNHFKSMASMPHANSFSQDDVSGSRFFH